jgi:hypothetical protein
MPENIPVKKTKATAGMRIDLLFILRKYGSVLYK